MQEGRRASFSSVPLSQITCRCKHRHQSLPDPVRNRPVAQHRLWSNLWQPETWLCVTLVCVLLYSCCGSGCGRLPAKHKSKQRRVSDRAFYSQDRKKNISVTGNNIIHRSFIIQGYHNFLGPSSSSGCLLVINKKSSK